MITHLLWFACALAAWFSPDIIEHFEGRPRREEDETIRRYRGA